MPREKLSPEALTLIYLRSERGWLQRELAARLGLADHRQISRYESGEKPLSRETLDTIAACLGHSREAVDALLFVYSVISPDPHEAASPVALTPEERRRIDRAALTAAWTAAEDLRAALRQRKRKEKAEAARRKAAELWEWLKAFSPQERLDLVRVSPECRSWALVVRVCEASVRAAADKPGEALKLADLALAIAERVEGPEAWRNRVKGFAWAHVANARRVANDFAGADEAFARAWELWRAGSDEADLLPEWRLLDLEASLRREQHLFPEALALLDLALAAGRGSESAAGRILLKKEVVLEQMGNIEGAIAVLAQAAPFLEAAGDPHLLFALRFNTANNLYHLERYAEAEVDLLEARELALRLGNELDLIRVAWLTARVAAGLGRLEEAIAGLEQVRHDFTTLQLPYDAARACLELAVLYLEDGRTGEVKGLAITMGWIFKAQGIRREASAALKLFVDAAREETATVDMARRVLADVEKFRHSAPWPEVERRGRGRS